MNLEKGLGGVVNQQIHRNNVLGYTRYKWHGLPSTGKSNYFLDRYNDDQTKKQNIWPKKYAFQPRKLKRAHMCSPYGEVYVGYELLSHSSFSLNWGPSVCFLFPYLQISMKWSHFLRKSTNHIIWSGWKNGDTLVKVCFIRKIHVSLKKTRDWIIFVYTIWQSWNQWSN